MSWWLGYKAVQLDEAPQSGLGDSWHGEVSRLQTPTGFPALYLLERPSALSHQKDKPIEGRQRVAMLACLLALRAAKCR